MTMWNQLYTVLVLASVGLFTGCGLQLADPIVESVEPSVLYNGADAVVVINGKNFFPKLEIEARDGPSAPLDEGYSAELVGPGDADARFALQGMSVLDYESLQAVVPEGLMVGAYDIIVTGPAAEPRRLKTQYKSRTHSQSVSRSMWLRSSTRCTTRSG